MPEIASDYRLELEARIIGTLIKHPESVASVLPRVSVDDFDEIIGNRQLYRAITALTTTGMPIDKITLVHELGNEELLPLVDASVRRAVSPETVPHYADILHEEAQLARLQGAAVPLVTAQSPDAFSKAMDGLTGLMADTRKQWQPVSFADALGSFADRHSTQKKPDFLDFGFPKLNRKLYCERGDFVIIAGEPSSGKTALAAQMAVTLAKKYRVGFFTLETRPEKLTDRIMAQLTRIPLAKIKENNLTDAEWKSISDTSAANYELQLEQVPAAGMTVSDIRTYAVTHKYDVIFVDYLQIVQPTNHRASRYEQVTGISLQLHTLAQFNGITVIALAQLARPDKSIKKPQPPGMHDLRESGQIEQDADAILLLYQENRNDNTGPRMLKIGKNKEGERDVFRMDFDGAIQTFRESHVTVSEIKTIAAKAAKEQKQQEQLRSGQYTILPDTGPLPF